MKSVEQYLLNWTQHQSQSESISLFLFHIRTAFSYLLTNCTSRNILNNLWENVDLWTLYAHVFPHRITKLCNCPSTVLLLASSLAACFICDLCITLRMDGRFCYFIFISLTHKYKLHMIVNCANLPSYLSCIFYVVIQHAIKLYCLLTKSQWGITKRNR